MCGSVGGNAEHVLGEYACHYVQNIHNVSARERMGVWGDLEIGGVESALAFHPLGRTGILQRSLWFSLSMTAGVFFDR